MCRTMKFQVHRGMGRRYRVVCIVLCPPKTSLNDWLTTGKFEHATSELCVEVGASDSRRYPRYAQEVVIDQDH